MPTIVHTTKANSLTVTIPSTTAGNCLVVCVASTGSSPSSISGITLGGSADNFASLVTANGTNGLTEEADAFIWADPNCAGGQTSVVISGSNLVVSSGSTGGGVVIYEISQISAASPLDKSSTGNGDSASPWSSGTTATTTEATEVWVGVASIFGGTPSTPSAPWVDSGAGFTCGVSGTQIVSSTGTATYSAAMSPGFTAWAAAVVTLKTQVSVSLPVAQVTIAAPALKSASPAPALPVAQVTINAPAPHRGSVVNLPVASANIRAYPPNAPVILPKANIIVSAWAPFVGLPPASPGVLPVLFGSAVGSGSYLPGWAGGIGGPGGPPAPGFSAETGQGSGWEVAVLGAPDYSQLLALLPGKILTSLQFTHQLQDAGSGTVSVNMDDSWWGPGWSFAVTSGDIITEGNAAILTEGELPLRLEGQGGPSPSMASFVCSTAQSVAVDEGDSFLWTGDAGVIFTVTGIGAPSEGLVIVSFSPPASGNVASGTVSSLNKAVLPNGQPAHYLLDYEHVWQVLLDGVPRFEFLGETVTENLVQASEQRIATITGPGTLASLMWASVLPQGFPDVVFKLDALTDSFSEVNDQGQYVLDTGLWNASSATGVSINPVGSARVTAAPGTTFLGSTAYDATETLISAQVTPLVSPDPAGNTLDNSQLTQFYIQDLHSSNYMLIGLSASSFYAQYNGPTGTTTNIITDINTFNAGSTGGTQIYQYWQISEHSGSFFVWTSADGQVWAQQFTIAHTGWNPTLVAFYFSCAYDVAGVEYATISSINSNVTTSSLGGPLYFNTPIMAAWQNQLATAQARGTIPFITLGTLSASTDSFGNPWSDLQSVQLQNGTDLLTLLQGHAGMINADYIMQPGFRLQVGIPEEVGKITFGQDRSSQIIFREGQDAMVVTRTRQRNQIQNFVAAINTDGRIATSDNTQSASLWGQREGWVQAAIQVTTADIAIVAEAAAEENGAEVLSYTLQILPFEHGRTIFTNFRVGDWVGLERPDYSAVDAVRVIAISVQVNTDGTEVHELSLISYSRWLQQQLTYITTKMGGGWLNAAGTTAISSSGFNQLAPTIFAPTLGGLGDVNAVTPGASAPLVFNAATGKWVPSGQGVDMVIQGVSGSIVLSGSGSAIGVNGSVYGVDANVAGDLTAASSTTLNSATGNATVSSTLTVGAATITQTNFNMSPPMAIPPNYPYATDPYTGPNWGSGERNYINQYTSVGALYSEMQGRGLMA